MKIIKRFAEDIVKEEAHGGSGARKVFADASYLNSGVEAVTYGYLPAGQTFDWHDHAGVEEIMVVLKGEGEVHDEDGVYGYSVGDTFIFPADTQHKIHNPTDNEHEMIFIRAECK